MKKDNKDEKVEVYDLERCGCSANYLLFSIAVIFIVIFVATIK
jgi:hypothetical protein